jgi:hypothetical protein
MVVDRRQGDAHNTVVSADTRLRLKRVTTTGVQFARSTTTDTALSTSGVAYRAMWTT